MEYPKIIKELLRIGGFEEVHNDDRLVAKELFRIKASHNGFDETTTLQVWFNEHGFELVLEMVDSEGEPRSLCLIPITKDEGEFTKTLLSLLERQGSWFKREFDEIKRAIE